MFYSGIFFLHRNANEEMKMTLSRAFVALREKHGSTVNGELKPYPTIDMAKHMGCSIRNVQVHMQDGCNPKFSTIKKLCESMGADVGELFAEYNKIEGL